MTDPTPTPQTTPQGLTDEQLLELATATSNYEMCGVLAIDRANHYGINGSELIAAMRAAIAADRAARPTPTPSQGLTDAQLLELAASEIEPFPPDYEAGRGRPLEVYGCELIAFARAAIAAHEAARIGLPPNYVGFEHTGKDRKMLEAFYLACLAEGGTTDEITLRGIRAATVEAAPAPAPTPKEVEARFRAWWAESFPNAPAGPHAVRSHVAFALHLLGGEVAA